jgi:Zn-dependent protease with chaperone function
MKTKNVVVGDFKKWLLYSFDRQEFKSHYDLFNALNAKATSGSITVSTSISSVDVASFILSHDDVQDDLEISDDQRILFIKYLTDNYFKTEDIDGVFLEKNQMADKAKNHGFVTGKYNPYADPKEKIVVRPHPKESTYYSVQLVASLLFYISIAAILGYAIMIDLKVLYSLAIIILVAGAMWLFAMLVKSIFIGIIKGSSIRVTKNQFPEIYEIIEEQATKLNVKRIPEIYITSGHFNAFVTQFSRANILMIYSEVVETALKGNYDVLKYVTGHELCHIKQKHLTKMKYLLPARMIPFLSLAYSRGCEYSCDRVGFTLSPKGSIEGLLIMTTGKEIHSKFNIDLHIKNALENEGFSTWFSEKFLTHPHLYKRLIEIKKFSKAA